jgi:hypothetical protein
LIGTWGPTRSGHFGLHILVNKPSHWCLGLGTLSLYEVKECRTLRIDSYACTMIEATNSWMAGRKSEHGRPGPRGKKVAHHVPARNSKFQAGYRESLAYAEVILPAPIGNHMVIQRDMPVCCSRTRRSRVQNMCAMVGQACRASSTTEKDYQRPHSSLTKSSVAPARGDVAKHFSAFFVSLG